MKICKRLILIFSIVFNLNISAQTKQVGICYTTWFPNLWGTPSGSFTWGQPQLGYYSSSDIVIIDKHVDMLTDAGVDFLVLDWSNNSPCSYNGCTAAGRSDLQAIEDGTIALFNRMKWRKDNGLTWLKLCIMIGHPFECDAYTNGKADANAQRIKSLFIDNTTFRDVYFYHRNKPLLVDYYNGCTTVNSAWVNQHQWTTAPTNTFTIRHMGAYMNAPHNLTWDPNTGRTKWGQWTWDDDWAPAQGPSYAYDAVTGRNECQTIWPAVRGDSWHGSNTIGRNNGQTFEKSWDYAISRNVEIALIQSWNEWTGNSNWVGEQLSQEFSRDVEPMNGGHNDLYLQILKRKAHQFKRINTASFNNWQFTSSEEGWRNMNNTTLSSSNGSLNITISGSDPHISSPNNLNLITSNYRYIIISLKNNTSDNTAELFWTTQQSPSFDAIKRISIPIQPNDTQQRYYILDMSSHASWTGTIQQLRFDPVNAASSGQTIVDFIKLTQTYGDVPIVPGIIEAENFNNGGHNNGYFDVDNNNNGQSYRLSEAVDIQPITGGGYNVGWSAPGEWMEYLFRTSVTDSFRFRIRTATIFSGKRYSIWIDGVRVAIITAANTNQWHAFVEQVFTTLILSQGLHLLRIESIDGDINFDKFTIRAIPKLTAYYSLNTIDWTQSNQASICEGASISFGPHPVTASGWEWSGPSNFTSSSRHLILNSVSLNQAGSYVATYTDANGEQKSITYLLTINPLPAASIIASGSTTFCSGGSVELSSNSGIAFIWRRGTNVIGSTASHIALVSGSYTVEVSSLEGCKRTSAPIEVSVQSPPQVTYTVQDAMPGIHNGSIQLHFPDVSNTTQLALSISDGSQYDLVDDALGSYTFNLLAPGIYGVWARWPNGLCPVKVGDIEIRRNVATSITASNSYLFELYPNPASDIVHIKWNYKDYNHIIEIKNSMGVNVYSIETKESSILIPVNDWAKGIYFFSVDGLIHKLILQ